MLTGLALQVALDSLPTQSFEGVLYRAVDLEALFGFHRPTPYPQPLPLFSEGARQRGARYTPIGGPASLYLALDPQTAYAEVNRVHTQAWSGTVENAPALPPTVLISVRARLDSILDITNAAIQQALQTTERELLRPWRLAQARGHAVVTQVLGQAVFDGNIQAIRYPSAQSDGAHCLVVFPERLVAPSYIETVDQHLNIPQRLP
jgi:RES domain-containing protein